MNFTTRFTDEMVSQVKNYCDYPDEAAAPEGGGSFVEYAVISLHRLRIFLGETYEMITDRLEVRPPTSEIIGLKADDLSHPSTLNEWLDKIVMQVWRVLLARQSSSVGIRMPSTTTNSTTRAMRPIRSSLISKITLTRHTRSSRPGCSTQTTTV